MAQYLGTEFILPFPVLLCRREGSEPQSRFLKCMCWEWKIRLETPPRVNPMVLMSTDEDIIYLGPRIGWDKIFLIYLLTYCGGCCCFF